MNRSRLACFKHFTYALLVLGLILMVAEIGLRWQASKSGFLADAEDGPAKLLTNSWLVHHRMKPLQTVETLNPDSGEKVSFVTNSIGLRGSEITVPKPKGVFRILCLGDESTLGIEVNESQTFCSLLEVQLAKQAGMRVEVINGGVPGYCPLLSYLLFKHSLLALQPDLVVLNFDMTDIADDHRYRRQTQVDQSGRPLACRHPDVKEKNAPRNRKRDRFLLVTWGRRKLGKISTDAKSQLDASDIDSATARYAWLRDRPPNWSVYLRQAFSSLADLNHLTNTAGAKLIVTVCPAPWQVSETASNSAEVRTQAGVPRNTVYRNPTPMKQLEQFLAERQIHFVNPLKAFREVKQSDRLFLNNAPRFSRYGHELHARELSQAVLPFLPRVVNSAPENRPFPSRTASRR